MNALDPDTKELYRFLGCEQANKIDKGKVTESNEGSIKENGKSYATRTV